MTERRKVGYCLVCRTDLIKIEGSVRPTFRADGVRYIRADSEDQGGCLFRCPKCHDLVDENFVWVPDEAAPAPSAAAPAADSAVPRVRLPNRRFSLRDKIIFMDSGGDRELEVSFGFDAECIVREVFCLAAKDGSDLQGLVHDACIAVSHALQRGARIGELANSFGELRPEGADTGKPASILGAVARAGEALELELVGGE